MTREEAKVFLISISHDLGTVGAECLSVKDGKKMRDAIETLEQEPCEDCISRQAVLDGIDNYIEKAQSTGTKDDFISFEELVVKALPPVTPKQKIKEINGK